MSPHRRYAKIAFLALVVLLATPSTKSFTTTSPILVTPSACRRCTHPQQTRRLTSLAAAVVDESGDRTLYDILGANGTETKTQLKQLYTTLAKQHHPDAIASAAKTMTININNNTTTSIPSSLDFSEIAAAYRTLADPKLRQRYDRSLQAAQFSKNVQTWADTWGRQAAPAVNQVLDQVAVPFLRRTTATTLAGLQAVRQDLKASRRSTTTKLEGASTSNTTIALANATTTVTIDTAPTATGSTDFLQTFEKAMAAAKRAGKYVDSIELTEKSQELLLKAEQSHQQALMVETRRHAITERRIQLAIHTPQSGLTSVDALFCLGEFSASTNTDGNKTITTTTRLDELTMMDRLLLRNTVRDEIEGLQKAEADFLESQKVDSMAQTEYQAKLQQQVMLQIELKQAKAAEVDARQALERALGQVAATKASLGKAADALSFAKAELEATSSKMDRKSHFLATQSERVRRHLVRKEKTIHEIRGSDILAVGAQSAAEFDNEGKYMNEIQRLQYEERKLTDEYEQLEATAARFTSRANVLMERAQEWKRP